MDVRSRVRLFLPPRSWAAKAFTAGQSLHKCRLPDPQASGITVLRGNRSSLDPEACDAAINALDLSKR